MTQTDQTGELGQPDSTDASRPTTLCTVRDPFEAETVIALLRAEGIEAFCQDATAWQMLWQMAPAITPAGLPVMVRQADLPHASQILTEVRAEADAARVAEDAEQANEFPTQPAELPPDVARVIVPAAEREAGRAEQDVRRGALAAAIAVFLIVLGLPLGLYALGLLWRGRAAWSDPDPAVRRRMRWRIVLGVALAVPAVVFGGLVLRWMVLGLIAAVRPSPTYLPGDPIILR